VLAVLDAQLCHSRMEGNWEQAIFMFIIIQVVRWEDNTYLITASES
jgi:hypothetical protein